MTPDEQAIRTLVSLWHTATAAPMRGRSTFERGLRTLLAQHRIETSYAAYHFRR